jgi:hypothetical protein
MVSTSCDWRSEREVDENRAGERCLTSGDTSQSLRAKLPGNRRGCFPKPDGETVGRGQNSYIQRFLIIWLIWWRDFFGSFNC